MVLEDRKHFTYNLVRKARNIIMLLADELNNNEVHCDEYGWLANYVFAMQPVSGLSVPMDGCRVVDQFNRWAVFVRVCCQPLLELPNQSVGTLASKPLSPRALALITQLERELLYVRTVMDVVRSNLEAGIWKHHDDFKSFLTNDESVREQLLGTCVK